MWKNKKFVRESSWLKICQEDSKLPSDTHHQKIPPNPPPKTTHLDYQLKNYQVMRNNHHQLYQKMADVTMLHHHTTTLLAVEASSSSTT